MWPCVCSVIDHTGRQNVVRTSGTLFCSYHILTSSVIYYYYISDTLGCASCATFFVLTTF